MSVAFGELPTLVNHLALPHANNDFHNACKCEVAEHSFEVCSKHIALIGNQKSPYIRCWIPFSFASVVNDKVDVLSKSKCQDALAQKVKYSHEDDSPLSLFVKVKVSVMPEKQYG